MKKPLCIVPWIYFLAEATGDVIPCCVNEEILGNVKEEDYKKIWNSEKMAGIRKHMITFDELPSSCQVCIDNKKLTTDYNTTYNLRDYYNNFFKSTFDEVPEMTNVDGTIKEDKIKFKSFIFKVSNKCNFQCRMCNGTNSSIIEGNVIENADFYKEFIEENIDDLELIEFVGGESFLMEETYDLLEYLYLRNKPHPHLHFNTNMSILRLGDRKVFDYLDKLDPNKFEIVASIDEIGDRAEYIRKGCVWKTVEKNLKLISNKKYNINTNIVASCYNVFRLPEIINHLVEIGYVNSKFNYQNFMFNPVIGDCDINLLSKQYKKKIFDYILNFIEEYNTSYNVDISYKFEIILGKLSENEPEVIDIQRIEFLRENHKNDILRGEKLLKTIPELIDIVESVKNGK